MHFGVYKSTVMFFGLTNSPVIFQAIINNILKDLIDTGDIAVFINDMLVRTENEKKHNEVVEEILRRIEVNNLYLKSKKYVWKVKEINFLELVMGADSIKMQKEKVLGVLEWPRPKIVKDVQKFLGLANYYRWFVKDFTKIAKPLYRLVRRNEK